MAVVSTVSVLVARFGPKLYGYSQPAALRGGVLIGVVGALVTVFVVVGHRPSSLGVGSLPARMALCCLAVIPWLSIKALAGLHVSQTGRRETILQLATDPRSAPGGAMSATVVLNGKRLRATAYGATSRTFGDASAGTRISATVSVSSWKGAIPGWAISQHLAGRCTLSNVVLIDGGAMHWRAAAWVRDAIARGAFGLPATQRALFGGFVLGDDRGQDPAVAEDFRAAGLSHLLVVSGQNVAFMLAAAMPLLRRAPVPVRTIAALGVIAAFAVITRFEPSVLRASTMAALVVLARATHRPQMPMRLLCLSVTLLLFVDPLLAWSVGFGLSVCATAGLALLAEPVEQRLRNAGVHPLLAAPMGATIAAQIGTYPLLVGLGGVSPVSVPANLLALPAAEPLMVWGVVIGVPAGLLGPPADVIVHSIDRALIWWVVSVARIAAAVDQRVPVPVWWPVIVCALIIVWRRSRLLTAVLSVASIGALSVLARPGPAASVPLANGSAMMWRHTSGVTVLVVRPTATAATLARSVREAGIGPINVVVLEKPTNPVWTSLAPLVARHRPGAFVTCGSAGTLGSTAVIGLRADDAARISAGGGPWVVVRCRKGRAVVDLDGVPQ